eukprot:CAMPEP_0119052656 /NCGR_PEP_ID=MMETSP1177-20130426/73881_1 /TAXON_ID=2985 /ORGANISM="Ochromonas sp, Strain CCMP1899" /LENGTH=143 /DNA_ID=CAMNT_0007032295 /DNA_START=18 /DNA_END=449 /DNA_ORIENTATION=+
MNNCDAVAKHFRRILRHVKSLPAGVSPTGQLRRHVIDKFQLGKLEKNEKQITVLKEVAYSYITLINSVQELSYLRSLDSGEKLGPRDKIMATGGRVGLGLPKFADEAEKEFLLRDKDMKPEDRLIHKITPLSPFISPRPAYSE